MQLTLIIERKYLHLTPSLVMKAHYAYMKNESFRIFQIHGLINMTAMFLVLFPKDINRQNLTMHHQYWNVRIGRFLLERM